MLSHYLLVLIFVQWASSQESIGIIPGLVSKCPEDETRDIEDRRRKCVAQKEESFQQNGSEKTQQLLCSFIEQIIEGCSKEYEKCYSERQMIQFKKLQLGIFEQLVGVYQNLGPKLDVCPTYKKYKEESEVTNSKCSFEQLSEMTKKYGTCTDEVQKFKYEDDNVEDINGVFCEFNKILNDCSKILKECYDDEKIHETTSLQLDIIKRFLDKTGYTKPINCKDQDQKSGAGTLMASALLLPLALLLN